MPEIELTPGEMALDMLAELARCEPLLHRSDSHGRWASGLAAALRRALVAEYQRDEARTLLSQCWTAAGLLGSDWTGQPEQAWDVPSDLVAHIEDLVSRAESRDEAEKERNKLQAFKDWVHGFLDAVGVPYHPPGIHGAEGCRIGDRLDWLLNRLRSAEFERDQAIAVAVQRAGGDPEVRRVLLDEVGTTEAELLRETLADRREHMAREVDHGRVADAEIERLRAVLRGIQRMAAADLRKNLVASCGSIHQIEADARNGLGEEGEVP